MNSLKDLIAKLTIGDKKLDAQNTIVPNLRHKKALEKSLKLAVSLNEDIRKGASYELVAIDIKEILDTLGEIIGTVCKTDVVDQIFNRFCIGK